MKFKVLPSATTLAADYTLSSGVVTIASGSQTDWYLYNLEKETATASQKQTGNAQNGTSFNDQSMTIILNKMDAAMQNEIKVLVQSRLQVAVKFNDGTYWLFGYQNGMDITTADGSTGTAFGDRNGYTISLVGKETGFPNMSAATYATL